MRRTASLAAVLCLLVIAAPAAATSDPLFGDQYGVRRIKAEPAWNTSQGHGVVIAIVDTGIDLRHEDLAAQIVAGRDFVDGGTPQDDTGGRDGECRGNPGHGTHVAGIAGAIANNNRGIAGVAPQAKLMPVRVLGKNGCGTGSNITEGIRWAADRGAEVINLSLGETRIFGLTSTALEDAVNDAWARGSIPVLAAGNDDFPAISYANINAVVVAATDENDTKAGFSNPIPGAKWGISAPGVRIVSALPGNRYAYLSGTSMAAPHISGALALLRCSGLSQQAAVDRLISTAKNIGSSIEYGAGLADLQAALSSQKKCVVSSSGGGASTGGSAGSSSSGGGSSPSRPGSSSNQPGGGGDPGTSTQGGDDGGGVGDVDGEGGASTALAPDDGEPTSNPVLNAVIVGALVLGGAIWYLLSRLKARKTAA